MLCRTKGFWRASINPETDTLLSWPIIFSIFRWGGWCVCDGAHWLEVMKNRCAIGDPAQCSPRFENREGMRRQRGRPSEAWTGHPVAFENGLRQGGHPPGGGSVRVRVVDMVISCASDQCGSSQAFRWV
jgi:hypothetical protein